MSPPRWRGILFIAESSNITKKPTRGQWNHWTRTLSKGRSLDDWMLEKRHRWSSVLSEMGQGELMGFIHCTRIPFILVEINQSHLLPLSKSYSSNPLVDPKTHFSTGTIELFLCHNSHNLLCLSTHVLCLALGFVMITSYHTFVSRSWQFCLLSAPLWVHCLHIPYCYLFLANWSMRSPALNFWVYK